MNRKLVFLDIDGTLTSPGSNVPPESALNAIKAAQNNGHVVFLCSGRNYDMLSPLLKYGFDGAVSSSGGYVFLGEKVDKILYDCPMTEEQKNKAIKLLRDGGSYLTLEAKDGSFCDPGLGEFLFERSGGNSELMRWREALEKDLGIRPMSEYDGRPIYKIVFMCRGREQIEPAIEALSDEFSFVLQDMNGADCLNGELLSKKFDKGTGVKMAAKALDIDIEDTIGFGDSMNDLEMIEIVGTSVCMENGNSKLKEISDIVCPAVDDDGIEWGFKKLGLI